MTTTWAGLKRWLHIPTRRGVERDVDAEIAFHVESRIRDLIAAGHDTASARATAEREYGDLSASRSELIDAARRRHDRVARSIWWESVRDDSRYAARALLRAPGLATVIIALLALGVGANVAAFAVADELFLRPPAGVIDPSNVTRLYLHTTRTTTRDPEIRPYLEYAAYDAVAAAVPSSVQMAAYTQPDSDDVTIAGAVHTLRVVYATSSFFHVLGAGPTFGRSFTTTEGTMGSGAPVAVISNGLWRRQFNGDSAVLGTHIVIALQRYTIIGVAPVGFSGPDLDRADIWVPIATYPASDVGKDRWYQNWRAGSRVHVLARVPSPAANATLAAAATAAFQNGQRANVAGIPDTTGTVLTGPLLETLGPSITPPAERAITIRLLGVTIIVLIIACANVANLLFVRGLRRRREIAIRLSLGIQRARLVRQLLLEGSLLALVSAIVALVVGVEGGAVLRAMILPNTHWAHGTFSWRLAATSIAAAVITGVVAALLPALRSSSTDLNLALKSGARDGGGQRSRVRSTLVVAQTALSVVLLAAAGLFVLSLRSALSVDTGYDAARVVFGTVYFRDPRDRYVDYFGSARAAELEAGLADVAARIASMPGVAATAMSVSPPLGGYTMTSLFLADGTPVPSLRSRDPAFIAADPGYLSASGMSLVRGRFFNPNDNIGSAPVVVVSETAARTYWPQRDAIGQCLLLFKRENGCTTVIGITRDTHLRKIIEPAAAEVFVPIAQATGYARHPRYLVARASPGRVDDVTAILRRELARAFPTAEPPWVNSAPGMLEAELRPWRLGASLFSLFGGIALIVATLGVYSVLAYSVSQRVHEMGVRAALGARQHQIVQLVLGDGARAIGAGIVVGLLLALSLGRFVASMLFATTARNPWIFGAASLAIVISGGLGSLVPAWRAMRVDPAIALRAD